MLLFGQHLEKLGLLFIATSVTLLAIKIVVNGRTVLYVKLMIKENDDEPSRSENDRRGESPK